MQLGLIFELTTKAPEVLHCASWKMVAWSTGIGGMQALVASMQGHTELIR